MSDDPSAAAPAAGDTTATPVIENTPAPAEGGDDSATLSGSLAGAEAAAVVATAGPSTWPEDWREKLTNGDEAGMALLKRYPSVDDLYKRVLSQEQIIRRGQHKAAPTLPENATEEQVAEYRKAIGVPEEPSGYGLKFAEELKPTEADNELLNGFLTDMHGRHVPPTAAKAAFEWYQAQMVRARETQAAEAQRAQYANAATLRKEYGADYMRNLGLADEFLEAYPGLKKIVSPTADVELLRDVVKLARASADEDALYGSMDGSGGKSLDDERDELLRKPKLTAAEDKRLTQIYEAITARDERRNRSRAA